jgi:hypothetical protein
MQPTFKLVLKRFGGNMIIDIMHASLEERGLSVSMLQVFILHKFFAEKMALCHDNV